MVALMSPEDSWVARWQKISKYLFPHNNFRRNLTKREIMKVFLILQTGLQKEFMLYLLLVVYLQILLGK